VGFGCACSYGYCPAAMGRLFASLNLFSLSVPLQGSSPLEEFSYATKSFAYLFFIIYWRTKGFSFSF
jgi:hypothetical protein